MDETKLKRNMMIYRNCPLCKSKNFYVKYEKNYSLDNLKENLFSARRERKKGSYEHNTFVVCKDCGLVYSNPILKPNIVEKLYKKSKFNYGEEENNLKISYGLCLKKAEKYVKNKGRILDIGAGNGFFLEEALKQGYKEVYGIEPSKHAIELANKKVKKRIINDILRKKQFKSNFFNVISVFQTIDHVINPNEFLYTCNNYLKNGGIILCVSHDVESLSAKIMGEKSPIFDIEHTQLFSKKTISKMLAQNGFKTLEIFDVINTYSLGYWIMLSPVPSYFKKRIISSLSKFNILNKNISAKVGNFGIIAIKYR